jgi:hypothetical protein
VDQRKLTTEPDADTPAAHGPEQANGAPSSDGTENGLAEHHSDPALSGHAEQAHEDSEPPAPPAPAADSHSQLEDRIRRLEVALAQLNALKERQAANAAAPVSLPVAAPVATVVPPLAAPFTTAPNEPATPFLFNVGKHLWSKAPAAPVAPPTPPGRESAFSAGLRWSSFFFDAYAELRAILRMFVDPRYQMSWTSRLVPLALALLLLTSGYWAPGTSIPGIGTLIDKLIDVPLAFLLFKVLSHEARRYRQTSPDLPPALRLPP